ncbi:hypothetical protein MHUMG1_09164 [Metarhizium humberi]|uniref:Uncharacterized protein n=1 Tax=Metarhizium humberi TaxID=2596975 RepID=A0A9P8S3X6_9HYPO|nr:hypothetical protein MHUMG1_09164 [Metarhizium humberi]
MPPHILLAQPILPRYPLLIRLSALVPDVYPARQNRINPHALSAQRNRHALRQPQKPSLCSRVRLVIGLAHHRPRRGHVNHAPSRRDQHVQTGLRHEHGRCEIRLDALIPLLQRHVPEGQAAHAPRVSGIVDQAVQAAGEEGPRVLGGEGDGARGAEVGHARGKRVAGVRLRQHVRRVLELAGVDVDEEHAVAGGEEVAGEAAADPACCAGDEEVLRHEEMVVPLFLHGFGVGDGQVWREWHGPS